MSCQSWAGLEAGVTQVAAWADEDSKRQGWGWGARVPGAFGQLLCRMSPGQEFLLVPYPAQWWGTHPQSPRLLPLLVALPPAHSPPEPVLIRPPIQEMQALCPLGNCPFGVI